MPHHVGIAKSNTSIFTGMVSNFYFIYKIVITYNILVIVVIRNSGKNYTIKHSPE